MNNVKKCAFSSRGLTTRLLAPPSGALVVSQFQDPPRYTIQNMLSKIPNALIVVEFSAVFLKMLRIGQRIG